MQDNYVWLLREPSGKTAIVDPSESKPVAAALEQLGVTPDFILNTHHHWDHTGCVHQQLGAQATADRQWPCCTTQHLLTAKHHTAAPV